MSAGAELIEFIEATSWLQLKESYLTGDPRVLLIGPSSGSNMPLAVPVVTQLLAGQGFIPESLDPHATIREKVETAMGYPIILAIAGSVGTATEVIFLLNHINSERATIPLRQLDVIVPTEFERAQFAQALRGMWGQDVRVCEGLEAPGVQLQLLVLDLLRIHMVAQLEKRRAREESEGREGLDDNGRRAIAGGLAPEVITPFQGESTVTA